MKYVWLLIGITWGSRENIWSIHSSAELAEAAKARALAEPWRPPHGFYIQAMEVDFDARGGATVHVEREA